MSSDPLICVQHVSKCYPLFAKPVDRLKQMILPRLSKMFNPSTANKKYYQEFWSLHDISFEIHRGEMVGIIGRNGSGKSTLLQIICGTLAATSGSSRVNGRVAALLELGAGFNPEFTGRENVLMNAAILGISQQEIQKKMDAIIAFAEIEEFIDRPVKTYSSGMYMRLAFSVAVSIEPNIVVVDEALAVGDIGFSLKCMQRIEEMVNNGVTFLLVTHDLGLIRSLCSRALYLKEGKAAFDGDPETATELFLMDMRGAQLSTLNQNMAFQQPLRKDGMAFGSGQSKILGVQLAASENDEQRTWFRHGERIRLTMHAWLDDALHAPAFAFAVRNHKGFVIFGMNTVATHSQMTKNGDGEAWCHFSFDARLMPGAYAITLRVLDFPVGTTEILIEKQLNAVEFEVIDDGTLPDGTYGLVELNGACVQDETIQS